MGYSQALRVVRQFKGWMAAADVQALIKARFFSLPHRKCELFHCVLLFSNPAECLNTLVLFHTACRYLTFLERYNPPALSCWSHTLAVVFH